MFLFCFLTLITASPILNLFDAKNKCTFINRQRSNLPSLQSLRITIAIFVKATLLIMDNYADIIPAILDNANRVYLIKGLLFKWSVLPRAVDIKSSVPCKFIHFISFQRVQEFDSYVPTAQRHLLPEISTTLR